MPVDKQKIYTKESMEAGESDQKDVWDKCEGRTQKWSPDYQCREVWDKCVMSVGKIREWLPKSQGVIGVDRAREWAPKSQGAAPKGQNRSLVSPQRLGGEFFGLAGDTKHEVRREGKYCRGRLRAECLLATCLLLQKVSLSQGTHHLYWVYRTGQRPGWWGQSGSGNTKEGKVEQTFWRICMASVKCVLMLAYVWIFSKYI